MPDATTHYDSVMWSKNLFDFLAEKAMWAVPRSGLVFQRQGNALVLVDRMPHDPSMPVTAEELAEQQDSEYDAIKMHFGEAGVKVRKALDA